MGWGCVNVLDMTSYILDVTLKVLGWGGAVLTLLIGRLAYRNLYKQIHVQKSVGQTLLSNDSCWHVELDSTWRHLKKCRPQSFQQKLNSKVNPMRYLNLFNSLRHSAGPLSFGLRAQSSGCVKMCEAGWCKRLFA